MPRVHRDHTPRLRHYHAIGLLADPERGSDDRRRYGYDDMVRLLWIRRMADAGGSLDDIHAALKGTTDIEQSLARLEEALAAKAAAFEAQRTAVNRLREVGSPLGLLSPQVTGLLRDLPIGALRYAYLDNALTDTASGPLAAYEPLEAPRLWFEHLTAYGRSGHGAAVAVGAAARAGGGRERPPAVAALDLLLEAGKEALQVRADVEAEDVLPLGSSLCRAEDGPAWCERRRRMLAVIIDGLRVDPPH